MTSQKEAQLAVLRDHIPKELRDLTVGLLTSDRQGLKLLEESVRKIATKVSTIDQATLSSEIVKTRSRLDQLYEDLAEIDSSIKELAQKQLSKVPFLKEEVSPARLAERVVEAKERYGWFDDDLGPEEAFDPVFDGNDIVRLREARKALGGDIVHLGRKYPPAEKLMGQAEILYIHRNMVEAKKVFEDIKKNGVPKLNIVTSESMQRLEKALKAAVKALIVLQDNDRSPWCLKLLDILRGQLQSGENSFLSESVVKLLENYEGLEKRRAAFLNEPIDLPKDSDLDAGFVSKVKQLAAGKKSLFGMLGKKELKLKIGQVKIEGVFPTKSLDWQKIDEYLSILTAIRKCAARWNALSAEFEGPKVDNCPVLAAGKLRKLIQKAANLKVVEIDFFPSYLKSLEHLFPGIFDPQLIKTDLSKFKESIETLRIHKKHSALKAAVNDKNDQLQRLSNYNGPVVDEIVSFLANELGSNTRPAEDIGAKWLGLKSNLERISAHLANFNAVTEVSAKIEESGAVKWAKRLKTEPFDENETKRLPHDCNDLWIFARSRNFLKIIDGRESFQTLSEKRIRAESDLERANLKIVELLTWAELKKNITGKVTAALRSYLTAIQMIGRNVDGVRSVRYRENAREAMKVANKAIPCWIMPHWRVSESLPAELGSFDLVIIDEASQSDAYALPSIVRGKKILVVGDDKQVSPSDVARKEADILYLRDKHLKAIVYGHLFLPGSSIYDLCSTVFGTDVIRLKEHFRCVEPIIQFSNSHFYQGELMPVRIPKPSERLDPPLIDVHVKGGYREGKSKINKPEARAILNEIMRITCDTRFNGRSIGVVSLLGFEQAQFIQNLLFSEIGEDKILKHDIKCGDAKYFQGKEADIVMISMVAAGKIQAQTGRIYEQRFNVAASRAKDRLYVFRSFDRASLSENDLRARLLDYIKNPSVQSTGEIKDLRQLCESDFERDVFDELTGRGFRVKPQMHAGDYRIDLVVEGENDARLAVELDGDKYHGIERWLEDTSRQRTLERMNWVFWRCWGSNYTCDKEGCLADLLNKLSKMGIEPIGYEASVSGGVSETRVIEKTEVSFGAPQDDKRNWEDDEKEESVATDATLTEKKALEEQRAEKDAEIRENDLQGKIVVKINDTVTYAYSDRLDEQKMVQIVRGQTNAHEGVISFASPIAQTLLGAVVGEEVLANLPTGRKRLQVLNITKS